MEGSKMRLLESCESEEITKYAGLSKFEEGLIYQYKTSACELLAR